MEPLPNHLVKDQDDSTVKLIRDKEFLQLTKEDDFQGYALFAKPKEEVKSQEPIPTNVAKILKQYPSIVVEEKIESLPPVKNIIHQINYDIEVMSIQYFLSPHLEVMQINL